ncbi:hypothetical protein C5Y93_29695 [Blastopirellula marina]|uniref:Uncharacterized protein n=1 Tax=Blastopirellula marina TaxID=124 RepID=A0A2S8GDW6_9BACT|nr:hypothetical protein C5Y93_29695 [Blastopirellula marina]
MCRIRSQGSYSKLLSPIFQALIGATEMLRALATIMLRIEAWGSLKLSVFSGEVSVASTLDVRTQN